MLEIIDMVGVKPNPPHLIALSCDGDGLYFFLKKKSDGFCLHLCKKERTLDHKSIFRHEQITTPI